ncbi:MAG: hypothetical protein R3F05_19110 [Planctomycetota bacterium]
MGFAPRSVPRVLIAAAAALVGVLALHAGPDPALPPSVVDEAAPRPSTGGPLVGSTPTLAPAPPAPALPAPDAPRAGEAASAATPPAELDIQLHDKAGTPMAGLLHLRVGGERTLVELPHGHATRRLQLSGGTSVGFRAVSPDGIRWSSERVAWVLPGSSHSVRLELRGPRVPGRILDAATGEPVKGASVEARSAGPEPAGRRVGISKSKSDGSVDLHVAFPMSRMDRLQVEHPCFYPQHVTDVPVDTPFEVQLRTRPRLRGFLTSPAGRVGGRAWLHGRAMAKAGDIERAGFGDTLLEARRTWELGPRDVPFAETEVAIAVDMRTEKDGSIDCPLDFPARVVGYVIARRHLAERFDIDTTSDARPRRLVLTPSPDPRARVRFVNDAGEPLPHMTVTVHEPAGGSKARMIVSGVTDEEGWFDTSCLPRGSNVTVAFKPRPNSFPTPAPVANNPFEWVVQHGEIIVVGRR